MMTGKRTSKNSKENSAPVPFRESRNSEAVGRRGVKPEFRRLSHDSVKRENASRCNT